MRWFKTLSWICGSIIVLGIIGYFVDVLICFRSLRCYAGPVAGIVFGLGIAGLALLVLIVAGLVKWFKKK